MLPNTAFSQCCNYVVAIAKTGWRFLQLCHALPIFCGLHVTMSLCHSESVTLYV